MMYLTNKLCNTAGSTTKNLNTRKPIKVGKFDIGVEWIRQFYHSILSQYNLLISLSCQEGEIQVD